MDKYNLLKDDNKNFYIINKSTGIGISGCKLDEKYFEKRKAKKLDNNIILAVTKLNQVYDEVAITILK